MTLHENLRAQSLSDQGLLGPNPARKCGYVLQINVSANVGSTGRIAEWIGHALKRRGYRAEVAYGRHERPGQIHHWRMGGHVNVLSHGALSLFGDSHGLGSKRATTQLLRRLLADPPDLVVLHNLHGYYLNYAILFAGLKEMNVPVVWLLHDCWAFTGHCAYFDRADCLKWQSGCGSCPLIRQYPKALIDRSMRNWNLKREAFTGLEKGLIVTPSNWLANHVRKSFLSGWRCKVIPNGVDLEDFYPAATKEADRPIALGVAAGWSARKGLGDLCALRQQLPQRWRIILVGVTKQQLRDLPAGVEGVTNTGSVAELAKLYARANVFLNPTYIDNFPTTNIEALACGTPVVTYNTGGSPEALDVGVGAVVQQGDLIGLSKAACFWGERSDSAEVTRSCRLHAERFFNARDRFDEHIDAYEALLND